MSNSLAILGAGNMAEAIVRGVLRSDCWPRAKLVAADFAPARRELFTRELGVRTVSEPAEAVRDASVVLLCVKPQQAIDVICEIRNAISTNALIISIAAGIPIRAIEGILAGENNYPIRVIRTMPNTPMLVGAGMVAIATGTHATASDVVSAKSIFQATARVIELPEDKIDAVTGVSGSGPAYFFFLVEQMIAAGIANGLSPDEATLLARQTAIGAGRMLELSTESAETLRQKVTSPGGTTHAAIELMKAEHFDKIILNAITAATRRGRELSHSM